MTGRSEKVRALEALRRTLESDVRRLEQRLAGRLSCRRGCSDCCLDGLTVLHVEAELIRAQHSELLATGTPAPEGRCAFQDAAGACRIYEHRPYVCRTQGLPLRWFEEADDAAVVERRDVCELSLAPAGDPREGSAAEAHRGVIPEELTEEECWLLGPYEDQLVRLEAPGNHQEPQRVALRSLFCRSLLVLLSVVLFACSASREPPVSAAARRSEPRALVEASQPSKRSAIAPVAASAAPEVTSAEPASDEPASTHRFPPPPIAPLHPRSAQPGDGEWRRLGSSSAGDRAADEPALLYTTVLHPHKISRYKTLTLVAVDLTRTRLGYSPGTSDLEEVGRNPTELGVEPGLVPAAERSALVAVMNGGFKPRHGGWGMAANGVVLVRPRAEGCTLLVRGDGGVELATHAQLAQAHPELAGTMLPPQMGYRQTPPCLVERGAIHPRLENGDDRAWGGQNPKLITRRRSAIGIDERGAVLFYGMGEELEPAELALGMRAAGSSCAAQFDINWSWTRFLLFGIRPGSERLEVTSTLIPKMVHERTGYVERSSDRDFFFLLRR